MDAVRGQAEAGGVNFGMGSFRRRVVRNRGEARRPGAVRSPARVPVAEGLWTLPRHEA